MIKGHRNKGKRRKNSYIFYQAYYVHGNSCDPDFVWAQTPEYKLYNDGRFYRIKDDPDEKSKAIRLSPLEKVIKKQLKNLIGKYPQRRSKIHSTSPCE